MLKRGSEPGRTHPDPTPGGSLFDRRRWVSIQAAPTGRIGQEDSEPAVFGARRGVFGEICVAHWRLWKKMACRLFGR